MAFNYESDLTKGQPLLSEKLADIDFDGTNEVILELPVINQQEFSVIPADFFTDNKTMLDRLFSFRIKKLRTDSFYTNDSIASVYKTVEINEAIETSLQFINSKLILSYLEKGKLCENECQHLIAGLKDIVQDLRDGGMNPGLYEYLEPHFNSLSKQVYQEKYHNIFEYMAKTLKSKLASEVV